ncbi:DedA family protein [Rhizobium sp. S-51]|jgi:membrane protein DedA with SNARE-associated domain|uniref:DedA family protein n=1 Tax=Rhizobium terricola TaxID=2728849 RepID=A0A7Y0FTV8_9HYPH|nr:DedA family protein [Rhizobium terricola]NML72718.1 DedA family protein [Rhizobium terricola]
MTEQLLALLPLYGLPLLAAVTALSCLGLPLPASIVMMLMGAFAAAGDFNLAGVFSTALAAAVLGDQAGFLIGRFGGSAVIRRLSGTPARKAALARAEERIASRGAIAVFLTRWVLAPLGPYVNLIAGATAYPWHRFTVFGVAGEVFWVGGYTGLGVTFSDNIMEIAEIAGSLSGFLAAAAIAALLGWRIVSILLHKD